MYIKESIHLRFNFVVNLMDGGFFGAALGFASFITVIPLFVSGYTESALLIGLIPAIHAVGWQLPQLFTAKKVSSLRLLRPTVLALSINERLPFLGLAIVAWFSGSLGRQWVLVLTFLLLIWQGFGGGFTANPWQSMIGKIIPTRQLGTFFGMQSATANIFASIAAVLAGVILERAVSPIDFTACFLFASIAMTISWLFLALTREVESPPVEIPGKHVWREKLHIILQRDINFRWFLVIRMISQFATMGFAFYTVFAVRQHGMSETTVGFLTAILMATQIVANPIMGWIGDHRGHRLVLILGSLASVASTSLAWFAPEANWFFLVFIFAGIANVATWTIPIAMTLEFGDEEDRPAYIGLANTLIAPFTFLAPLFGGWIADQQGYSMTFFTSAVLGLVTVFILLLALKDPRAINEYHIISSSDDLVRKSG